MGTAGDYLTYMLDPVLVPVGFLAGQGGIGVSDAEPVGITYCAGHDALSDRCPWLPQAHQYPVGSHACTDIFIAVSAFGVVEQIDFEGHTLGETLAAVGDWDDAKAADQMIGSDLGQVLDVLPGILQRLFREREVAP